MASDWFNSRQQRQQSHSEPEKSSCLMSSWTNNGAMQLQSDTDVVHLHSLNPGGSSAMPAIIQHSQGYCNHPAVADLRLTASHAELLPAKSPNLGANNHEKIRCQEDAQLKQQQQLLQAHSNHLKNTIVAAGHMQGRIPISVPSSSHDLVQGAASRSSCMQPQNRTLASTSGGTVDCNLEYSLAIESALKGNDVSGSIGDSKPGSGHGNRHQFASTSRPISKEGATLLAAGASANRHKDGAMNNRISKVSSANYNEIMHARMVVSHNPTSMGCSHLAMPHNDTLSITSSKLSTSSWLASAGRQDLSPEEKEMLYRAAAMQPIGDINPMQSINGSQDTEVDKPKPRRNVRISKDPQSVAARHRRQRISSKMRVLQKLVPGGMKMDTASMLEEAAHYLKFLKAEVEKMEAIEQLMNVAKGQVAQMQGTSINQAISKTAHTLPYVQGMTNNPTVTGPQSTSLSCNYPPSAQQLPAQNYLYQASLSF